MMKTLSTDHDKLLHSGTQRQYAPGGMSPEVEEIMPALLDVSRIGQQWTGMQPPTSVSSFLSAILSAGFTAALVLWSRAALAKQMLARAIACGTLLSRCVLHFLM